LNDAAKKDGLLGGLNTLWKNGIFKTLLLLVLVVLGNFLFQEALVLILKTDRPLQTPISPSMEPTLKVGDLLIIQGGLRAEDVYANPVNGDIIVFRNPRNPNGIPIVHRAIDKFQEEGKWYFITKGDANTWDDYKMWGWKIPEDYLIGKVIVSIPLLGYVLRFLDETKIYLGGYTINLRTIIIVLLIAAVFLLEYTGSSEEPEKTQETEETDKE